eukprot:10057976-Alexandrium_andersonii.AAC.1
MTSGPKHDSATPPGSSRAVRHRRPLPRERTAAVKASASGPERGAAMERSRSSAGSRRPRFSRALRAALQERAQ